MIRQSLISGSLRSMIPVGDEKSQASTLRLFRGLGELGHIYRDEEVRPWKMEGFTVEEGRCWLYGPALELSPLVPLPRSLTEEEKLLLLAQIARACGAFLREGLISANFRLEQLYQIRQGGFLLLASALSAHLPEGGKIWGPHPTSPLGALSAALGREAFAVLSRPPAPDEDWTPQPPPLPALRPDIRAAVVDFIARSLQPPRGQSSPPGPDLWEQRLEEWARDGYTRGFSPEEGRRQEKKSRRALKAWGREQRLRFLLRRRGGLLAGVAGALALLLFAGFPLLQGLLSPPLTAGLSPEEVVHLFYSSMGRLDMEAMQDCVAEKAGRHYIDTTAHLYTISRVRYAVEGQEEIMDARDWEAAERPTGRAVFGAAELSVTPLPAPEGEEEVFLVRFDYRRPLPGNNPGSQGRPMEDRVYTRLKRKKVHRIVRIEHLSPTFMEDDGASLPH